jgi:hypothetical protein
MQPGAWAPGVLFARDFVLSREAAQEPLLRRFAAERILFLLSVTWGQGPRLYDGAASRQGGGGAADKRRHHHVSGREAAWECSLGPGPQVC